MKVTLLGHAALLIETDSVRLLTDPGVYSTQWQALTGLDAVLVTHEHHDHLDQANFPALVHANPDARVLAAPGAGAQLAAAGVEPEVLQPGSEVTLGSTTITAVGGSHALVHGEIPRLSNLGFVIDDGSTRLFHPGDAYDTVPERIDALALPLSGPWTTAGATADFLRAVRPKVAFPIHDAGLSATGRATYLRIVGGLVPGDVLVTDGLTSFDV